MKNPSLNIIITGSSSGIGKALKEHYKSLGHNVIGISKTDDEYTCDVSSFEDMKAVFEDISKKIDKIDIVIPCAGFGILGAVELIPNETIQKEYDVLVMGSINTVQCALPLLRENGKIVFISSTCALFPVPFRSIYCSSKAAVSMLSDGLRMELSKTKIQVTSICPCEIKTNFSKNRDKTFATNEKYNDSIELCANDIESRDNKRMSLEKATRILVKIIDKKKYKPQYIISFKFKVLYVVAKFFPKSLVLKVLNKMFFKVK